jgi:hypothetical protein
MRKRRFAALAIVPTVVAAVLSLGPTAANAFTTSYFKIINQNSGKCLDVYNWSTAAGANIDQWTCGSNQANQLWRLFENSDGDTFSIQNENSGMCLEPETNEIGVYIVQNPCSPSDQLQEWVVVPDGNVTYYENSVWPPGGAGLDVYGASTANHAWIDLWYMNWNPNQQWNVPPGF